MEQARQFAIENEQLAFFVISTGTEIRLDGQARVLKAMKKRSYAPTWYSAARLERWQFGKQFIDIQK